ncbi:MAG: hypothetical protein AB7G38_16930 [Dehalococcoidia bacterium]
MKRFLAAAGAGLLALALVACGGDDEDGEATPSTSNTPAASADSAKPLTFDTSYGTSGVATVPLNANTHDRFMAVTQGSDGKTYAAGFIIVGEGDQAMAVARLTEKGALDTTFGTGGIASVNVGVNGKTGEIARAISVQSDGKIVIAGPFEKDVTAAGDAARDTDVAVVRFDATGKPDASFGTNGVAKLDFGAGRITTGTTFVGDTSWGMGIAGGKIVVFGSKLADGADRVDTDYVIAALTSAGQPDASFGTGGKTVVDVSKVSDNPRNLLVESGGKIVASGYSNVDGVVQPVLIRVDGTGKLDTSFGTNGTATAKVLAGVTEAYSVTPQGSNYILAGYGRGADTAEKVDMVVYRFTGTGTLDTSFGEGGVFRLDIAKEDDRARNVMVLPDGRILALGSGKKDAANVDAMVVLLSKDGAPVTGFGDGGKIITDLGGPVDAWYGVTLSADKKYVLLAGYKGTDANSAGNDDAVVAKLLL